MVCSYNDPKGADALISQHPSEIGAILVEPMLGAGGCVSTFASIPILLRFLAKSID